MFQADFRGIFPCATLTEAKRYDIFWLIIFDNVKWRCVTIMQENMQDQGIVSQAYDFHLCGEPMFCTRYGNGHINTTYLLVDTTARQYILQKINSNVFRNPQGVMENIAAVTTYLRSKANSSREVLSLIPTKGGDSWLVGEQGDFWRMYPFISDSLCLDRPESSQDFKESGIAFGHFQRLLSQFPADTLTETIPNFHNTPVRYQRFKEVLAADPMGRAKDVQAEIDFVLARESYASTLMDLLAAQAIPLRVTHNDTKLNNVLFDRESRTALCVIDLDTVMPGLAAHDFGDSIRFGASTALEDEVDLSKVTLSLPLFEAYTEGFLASCGSDLTETEILHLRDGVKMMTLECGLRFLTDYLEGDVYFRTTRPGHNLDRARTQLKLVSEIETYWSQLQDIILKNRTVSS